MCSIECEHVQLTQMKFYKHIQYSCMWKKVGPFDEAAAQAEVLELCLRQQLVTYAAHFKFQSQFNSSKLETHTLKVYKGKQDLKDQHENSNSSSQYKSTKLGNEIMNYG